MSYVPGFGIRRLALPVGRWPTGLVLGYRDHGTQPPVGHLETAHLCWALGTAVDLGVEAFTRSERQEIEQVLREKGIALCRHWLQRNTHLANWRAVMAAGVAVAAAAINDRELLAYAAGETQICAQAFQPDGSYAESLQYANYLAYSLMIANEAIRRAAPDLEPAGSEVIARPMPWIAQSMLYRKPLAGWDAQPRARAVNFNDCAATYRPSGDVLLHVATRCRQTMPTEAGLARWLFDTFYTPVPAQAPHNLATFGLRNDWGFLTLPFLPQSADALSPEAANLPLVAGFSNGNVFVRDSWEPQTVLAAQAGSGPLYGPGHLHGDLASFILTYHGERVLADAGHNCYRNLTHGLESATQTHNTCTFLVAQDKLGLQEDLAKATLLEQSNVAARRQISAGQVSNPVAPRGRRLLLERAGQVTAIGTEVAGLYGPPIEELVRVWLQAGSQVLFVVDRIRSSRPVTTVWNWLLNNRDGDSEIDVVAPNEIVLRRHLAGLKLAHLADGRLNGPVYAFLNDAYHPEPARVGEGRSGTGMLFRWVEPRPRQFRVVVHAFALDDYGLVDDWVASKNDDACSLRRGEVRWSLSIDAECPLQMTLRSEPDGESWLVQERDGNFCFETGRCS